MMLLCSSSKCPEPNPTYAGILAKSEIKARWVNPDAETNSLADMTERELVVKTNIALEGLEEDWWGNRAVVGARKLRNGG